jgi:hypothetical protein
MNTNPCLGCARINEDKNNPECLKCEKRVNYVRQLAASLNCGVSCAEDFADLNLCCPTAWS